MLLLESLWNVVVAVAVLAGALLTSLVPWLPLIAWIAFWLFAVNWKQLYPVLGKGGMVGVLLLAVMSILVWSSVSVPPDGQHHFGVLHVSNLVGKTVYVTGLVVIAFLCGSVQLNGWCGSWCRFEEEPALAQEPAAEHPH